MAHKQPLYVSDADMHHVPVCAHLCLSLQDVITLLGITDTVAQNLGILFALLVGFLVVAYFALWNAIRALGK